MYNLVIAGGGIKAYSSIGAIRLLEENGMLFNKFIGVSAGSIIATLLSLGCDSYSIQSIYDKIDLSRYKLNYNKVSTYWNLFWRKGIFKNEEFRDGVIGKMLEEVCGDSDITFKDIYERYGYTLVISGTCINKSETHYYHYISNPDMKVKQAIAISCCVPFLFTPVTWKEDILVDGGVIENYPLYFFNDNELPNSRIEKVLQQKTIHEKSIGIKFTDSFTTTVKNNNLIDYIKAIIYTFLTNNEKKYIREGYWSKTILIEVGYIDSITDFNINLFQKKQMLISGYCAARSYIDKLNESK